MPHEYSVNNRTMGVSKNQVKHHASHWNKPFAFVQKTRQAVAKGGEGGSNETPPPHVAKVRSLISLESPVRDSNDD